MSIKIEGGGSKENIIKSGTSNELLYNDKEVFLKENLLNLIYPVGSLYWSMKNVSPGSFIGGTWEQIENKFILAAGSSYTAGNTGGESTVTLTKEQMPEHSHSFTPSGSVDSHSHDFTPNGTISEDGKHTHTLYFDLDTSVGNAQSFSVNKGISRYSRMESGEAGTHEHTFTGIEGTTESSEPSFTGIEGTTETTGSGNSHNNMPPYLVAYCWKRTA